MRQLPESPFGSPGADARLRAAARQMSDDELRVGLAVAAARRDGLVESGQHWLAEQLQAVCLIMAEVRDERAALARATAEAMVPAGETRILATAASRRNRRRRRRRG